MSNRDKLQVYFPEKVYKLHAVNLYHFDIEREIMKTAGAKAPAVGDMGI